MVERSTNGIAANKPDNHFLDGMSGSAIMASILGATLAGPNVRRVARPKAKRRITTRLIA